MNGLIQVAVCLLVVGAVRPSAAQPANDNFATAVVITTTPFTDVLSSVVGGTTEAGEPVPDCQAQTAATVWYKFTPTTSTLVVADTFGSTFDTVLAVYRGQSLATLVPVDCSDDVGPSLQSRIVFAANGGTSYYFQIGEHGQEPDNPSLTFNVSTASVPPNDNFANATVIGATPFTATVDSTVGATVEPGEPVPACNDQNGETVWYRFTPATPTVIVADTFGSTFDTILAAYTGSSLDALTAVACSDDVGDSYQSRVEFAATAGTTYYFQAGRFVQGDVPDTGSLTFNLTTAANLATPTSTPPPTRTSTTVPVATRTATPHPTATRTPVPTARATATASVTGTPSPTRTVPPVSTATSTPVPSGTPPTTPSGTPKATGTVPPLATATGTVAPTFTRTHPPTLTPTAVATGTGTQSPTATRTPSVSPTMTPGGSPTVVRTPSASPTTTSTSTVGPLPTATPTPRPCVGDCNGDGQVTVNELVRMVNIALGTAPLSDCPVGDANGDDTVTVNEIIVGVNHALDGCF